MTKKDAQTMPAQQPHQDWHAAYIVYQLRLRGLSLRKLSRLRGYCPSSAANALRFPWPKMEKLIADALGVAPSEIWPSRYNEHGESNRLMGRPRKSDGTDSSVGRNVYVKRAA